MSALLVDIPSEGRMPVTLEIPESMTMDEKSFAEFCTSNPALRIEQDSEGNVIVMSPVNPASGNLELRLGAQLQNWTERDGRGIAFSSSTIFTLRNGARRSPDASWLLLSDWQKLDREEQLRFSKICPRFVLELRSPSDRLDPLHEKMKEYLANGATLGILIDPVEGLAHRYRPNQVVETFSKPASISAEPELPGLEFDLAFVWQEPR